MCICKEDIIRIDEFLKNEYRQEYAHCGFLPIFYFTVPGYDKIMFYELSDALQDFNIYSKISRKEHQEHCQFIANAVSFDVNFLDIAVVRGSKLVRDVSRISFIIY